MLTAHGTIPDAVSAVKNGVFGYFAKPFGAKALLDEIGDMPPAHQIKLLRALQERQVRPVGGLQDVAIDVRVISATHRDLEAEFSAGCFCEDLYCRLKMVCLRLPCLQERREDIAPLVTHFLNEWCCATRSRSQGRRRRRWSCWSPRTCPAICASSTTSSSGWWRWRPRR
jgi:two-component system response regulator GlrR